MLDKDLIYNILLSRGYYRTIFNISDTNQRGNDIQINCPFPDHRDSTPSFSVSTIEPLYHCYGCGNSGDWLDFLQKHNHWSFKQALEFLASEAGVSEESYTGVRPVKIERTEKKEREITQTFIDDNLNYYVKCVTALEQNPKAQLYFEKTRGIKTQEIQDFPIGIDTAKREWIIPVVSIEHSNENGSPQLVGFERRRNDFTNFFEFQDKPIGQQGKDLGKCLKRFGTPSTMCCINYPKAEQTELILLEGMLDSYVYLQYLREIGRDKTCLVISPSCGLSKIIEQVKNLDTSRFNKVSIMLDSDDAGIKAMEKLNELFPNYKYIKLQKKDFTDFYLSQRKPLQ